MRVTSILLASALMCFLCGCTQPQPLADPAGNIAPNGANTDCRTTTNWPDEEYKHADPPVVPSLSPGQARDAGRAVAQRFISHPEFAAEYLKEVRKAKRDDKTDYAQEYGRIIEKAYPAPSGYKYEGHFNANDFANVHHAAWLYLMRAFSSLVDKNPHHNGTWGDPDCFNTRLTNGKEDHDHDRGGFLYGGGGIWGTLDYHNVPNAKGYYALNTADVPPPDLSPRETGR